MFTYELELQDYSQVLQIVDEAREIGIPVFVLPEEYAGDTEFFAALEMELWRGSRAVVPDNKAPAASWIRRCELPEDTLYGVAVTNTAVYLRIGDAMLGR